MARDLTYGTRPARITWRALAAQACGAFEDWVYALYREKDGLHKPGNAKLFELLCGIRSHLSARLQSVLVHGFSDEPDEASKKTLFGGCYFAATGASADRQAFVKSALDKLILQEEDLEWTDAALAEEARLRRLAQFGQVLNAMLAAAIAGMLIWRYFGGFSA